MVPLSFPPSGGLTNYYFANLDRQKFVETKERRRITRRSIDRSMGGCATVHGRARRELRYELTPDPGNVPATTLRTCYE